MPAPAGVLTSRGGTWLLCPPRHYAIRYEINPWMNVDRPVLAGRAARQWRTLREAIVRAGGRVRTVTPQADLPDLVFSANAGVVVGRTVILSRFRHAERRREEPVWSRWFRRQRYRVVRVPGDVAFEGEGDLLRVGGCWFMGYGFRTRAGAAGPLARLLRGHVEALELVDHRFYHLDTCFAPLDDRTALWYPGAFTPAGRLRILSRVPDRIAVTEEDALQFACNALVVGRTILAHAGASRALIRAVEWQGFTWRELDLSEFLKAGGSAKCLALRLDRPMS